MALVRIDGRYRLQGKIWSGPYSEIYHGHDILLGQDVVLKLEPVHGKHHLLEHEYQVYKKLGKGIGIPRVRWFGTEAGFDVMAIDRLGHSLEDIFLSCRFRFSIRNVSILAYQLISRLQFIHSRNFVHRDLKPSNILLGVGEHANLVYIIDFGLSKEFRDPDTHRHIPYRTALGLTGTPTFASINSHLGLELGRRDDLESLAYILIYFLRGSLPWQGAPVGNRDLVENKQTISTYDLCRGVPAEFCTFLEYSRSLAFSERPDYDYLRGLFDNLLLPQGFRSNLAFNWDASDGPADSQPCNVDSGCDYELGDTKHHTGLRSQSRQKDIKSFLS